MPKKEKKLRTQEPTIDDEEVLFACWGIDNKKDDKNYVFEKGKPVDVKLLKVQESETYRFTYKCKIADADLVEVVGMFHLLRRAQSYVSPTKDKEHLIKLNVHSTKLKWKFGNKEGHSPYSLGSWLLRVWLTSTCT